MKKFNMYLYDNLNRKYDRRNLYLYEVAVLQEKIENAQGNEKEQLKKKLNDLVKNKQNHDYNKKLEEFKNKEKAFIADLNKKATSYIEKVDKTLPSNVQKLEVRLFKAQEMKKFYENYVTLTYDAELVYEQSKIEIMQIPPVIDFAKGAKKELELANKKKSTISEDNVKKYQSEFNKFKADEKVKLNERIKDVKKKQKEGLISKQARENTIIELKRKYKELLLRKSFENEKIYNDEIIKNKKHELKKVVKQKINTVNINVADVRRVSPIESEKTLPWLSYVTFLIPGLGQLCNKQYIKAIIMFFATIYIYGMAIPYALGFGNYKGQGIAGLISLADGAARLDRSIIFMIEGILAIVLIVIGLIILYLSFKDVNAVEKERIKGVRVNTWIETREKLTEEGIPYLISVPALLVVIFIVIIPILTTIFLSFTGMDPNNQAKFGWEALKNYKIIALGQGLVGSIFWKILGWTIVWTICASSLGIALGFFLAILLNNDRVKGKVLFRTIYLLPWAVPAFISIAFLSILCADNGVITQSLKGIFGSGFAIKNDPFVSRVALICMQGWLGSAYIFLLSTGVLQSINAELYEAADIDGATSIKKLTKITVPLVLFQTAPLLVSQYTFNFNNFSAIYLFNGGGPFYPEKYGNLAGSTDLLISYIYKLTMENQYQALGAAISILISIALMIIAYIGFRNTEAFKKE